MVNVRASSRLDGRRSPGRSRLSLAKTPPGGQVVDLTVLIRPQSQFDDHSPAPPASAPPLPLRWPPPARPGEPRSAPATRRIQTNGASAQAAHDGDRKSVV